MGRVGLAVVAGAVFVAVGAFAPVAQAAPCDGKDLEQPFLDWNDKAFYSLVENGSFESGASGWELSGDADLAGGGNTHRPSSSSTALKLPAGSSATSPPVCVTKGNPTARIFGRTVDAENAERGALQVQVLYLKEDGTVRREKFAGKLRVGRSWDATRKFSLAQGQFHQKPCPESARRAAPQSKPCPEPCAEAPATPTAKPCEQSCAKPCGQAGEGNENAGSRSWIQLRFKPVRGSSWKIDDVFVDPRRHS